MTYLLNNFCATERNPLVHIIFIYLIYKTISYFVIPKKCSSILKYFYEFPNPKLWLFLYHGKNIRLNLCTAIGCLWSCPMWILHFYEVMGDARIAKWYSLVTCPPFLSLLYREGEKTSKNYKNYDVHNTHCKQFFLNRC